MTPEEFIGSGVEPLPDNAYGPGFRCSAQLSDDTQLPCVIIRRKQHIISLAERRLTEESTGKGVFANSADPRRDMLAHFVTTGNRVNAYSIKAVAPSRFAVPLSVLQQIRGETVMAWTGFVLEMADDRSFSFGTSFGFEFFDVPEGYGFESVKNVINHAYIDPAGNLAFIRDNIEKWRESLIQCTVYRSKPYFNCFV
jgi:hypothetical protein